MRKFYRGEILNERVFCRRNFPFRGWNFKEKFPIKGFFQYDLKKYYKLNGKQVFFK